MYPWRCNPHRRAPRSRGTENLAASGHTESQARTPMAAEMPVAHMTIVPHGKRMVGLSKAQRWAIGRLTAKARDIGEMWSCPEPLSPTTTHSACAHGHDADMPMYSCNLATGCPQLNEARQGPFTPSVMVQRPRPSFATLPRASARLSTAQERGNRRAIIPRH